MNDFIGLGLLAVGLLLLSLGAHWFRPRFEPIDGKHYLRGDFYALVVSGFIVSGASMVIADMAHAWLSGNITHMLVGLVGIAVFALVAWFGPDLLRRRRRVA